MGDNTSNELFGGQELLLAETLDVLKSMGHEVSVIQLGPANWTREFNGIQVTCVKAPKLQTLQRAGFIRRWTWAGILFYKHIDQTADWVHFHNHHFSFPCILKRKSNQIFTGMNHGVEWDVPWVYDSYSLANLKNRFSFCLLKLVTRFSIKNLDKIITNDRFFIHFATLQKPSNISKFSYIPNYFDERIFQCDLEYDLPIHLKKELLGVPFILLPKMSMRERGTDMMLDVMKSVPEPYKLVITGTSQETKGYMSLVEQIPDLNNRIVFTGHVDYRRELPAIFSAAEVVVIPSPCREATAIALLEALAMKKPVLVSEIGGLVEIIDNKVTGVLCKPTPDDFRRNLLKLISEDLDSKSMTENGYWHVVKHFNRHLWRSRMSEFFVSEEK